MQKLNYFKRLQRDHGWLALVQRGCEQKERKFAERTQVYRLEDEPSKVAARERFSEDARGEAGRVWREIGGGDQG